MFCRILLDPLTDDGQKYNLMPARFVIKGNVHHSTGPSTRAKQSDQEQSKCFSWTHYTLLETSHMLYYTYSVLIKGVTSFSLIS